MRRSPINNSGRRSNGPKCAFNAGMRSISRQDKQATAALEREEQAEFLDLSWRRLSLGGFA